MYMLLNTRKYPESVPGILSKPFLKLIDLMQAMYHFVQGVLSLMDFLCVLVECFLAGSIYLKKKKKEKSLGYVALSNSGAFYRIQLEVCATCLGMYMKTCGRAEVTKPAL